MFIGNGSSYTSGCSFCKRNHFFTTPYKLTEFTDKYFEVTVKTNKSQLNIIGYTGLSM